MHQFGTTQMSEVNYLNGTLPPSDSLPQLQYYSSVTRLSRFYSGPVALRPTLSLWFAFIGVTYSIFKDFSNVSERARFIFSLALIIYINNKKSRIIKFFEPRLRRFTVSVG